ncbi:MAG: endonuclease/exonuclease/phosphatase family protein [Desulfobacterales bacterium]
MKRLYVFALVGLLFLGTFSAPAVAGRDIVKVMTRNQYLGADLMPLVTAGSPEDFLVAATAALEQIAANNFPLRARRLAAEIALTKPDLIGLQEVYDFTVNGFNIGPPFVNHLDETLTALNDRGQNYEVAATLNNMDITVPIEGIGLVRVLDRDVILVREGVTWENLSGSYTTDGLCEISIPNPASAVFGPSTLTSTPSEDGCNYTIAAEVDSPVGPITIERGFVGVDATVRGKTYRFVSTHLEQRQPDPADPSSRILQFLQSVELIGTLQAVTPPDLPLILLGDFNSSSEDESIDSIIPPYQVIVGQGFADVWDTNPLTRFDPEGLTCCEFADLSNRRSDHYERVDIIFVSDTSFLPWAFVTGRVPIFPLRLPPNWASDHRGVFGKLIFRRGAMD